jgi:hypothetical protein
MQDKLAFEAMVAPCDLWVLPSPRVSRWFTYLDWYLNWQMCKGLAYSGLHLPAETYRVAEEYGVPMSERGADESAPLLIASEGRVPAKKCLVLDSSGGMKEWLAKIRKVASQLGVTTVRIFLPSGADESEAKKHWKDNDITAVFHPDLETA